jgi:hypothetical protein
LIGFLSVDRKEDGTGNTVIYCTRSLT